MHRRLALSLPFALAVARSHAGTGPTVAAASDLKFALDEAVADYAKSSGGSVRLVYGSSGNLARQLEQGAPFDVFMSADEAYVDGLVRQGLTVDGGELYGIGRLAVFAAAPAAFAVDDTLAGLRRALDAGAIRRFAIANPEHAPYGRAAREALQSTRLWSQLDGKLVLGENVSQAAQFATSGNAQGGIFALSLAMTSNVSERGSYAPVASTLHRPLRQKMVLMRRSSDEARDFYRYLRQPAARRILQRHGFALPGE